MEVPETPQYLLHVLEELIEREPIFHRHEQGTSREQLEVMTDTLFWEIGASGRIYSRDFVIETVLHRNRKPVDKKWMTEDFRCQEIAADNYLLTYTLHQGARVTRRSTLWRRTPEGWKMVFHQGTVVEPQVL